MPRRYLRILPRPFGPLARWIVVVPLLLGPVPAAAAPTAAGPEPEAPGSPTPVGVWPLHPQPEVVAGFDPPDSTWGSGHRGVDLLGSVGQHVRTALDGRISFAGRLAGRGVVVVDHGATRTTYEPVTATVHVGEEVTSGETLGLLELSGSHCFPRACLHWGWLRGETYLDPLLLVGSGPVRLLPLSGDEPSGPAPTSPWAGWSPPASPYAAWQSPLRAQAGSPPSGPASAQARGCACW